MPDVRRLPGMRSPPAQLSIMQAFENNKNTLADVARLVDGARVAGAPEDAVIWTQATRMENGEIRAVLVVRWPEGLSPAAPEEAEEHDGR